MPVLLELDRVDGVRTLDGEDECKGSFAAFVDDRIDDRRRVLIADDALDARLRPRMLLRRGTAVGCRDGGLRDRARGADRG